MSSRHAFLAVLLPTTNTETKPISWLGLTHLFVCVQLDCFFHTVHRKLTLGCLKYSLNTKGLLFMLELFYCFECLYFWFRVFYVMYNFVILSSGAWPFMQGSVHSDEESNSYELFFSWYHHFLGVYHTVDFKMFLLLFLLIVEIVWRKKPLDGGCLTERWTTRCFEITVSHEDMCLFCFCLGTIFMRNFAHEYCYGDVVLTILCCFWTDNANRKQPPTRQYSRTRLHY